ncbi:hypothetical protein Tco_0013336 [Tanacetum coccineum]
MSISYNKEKPFEDEPSKDKLEEPHPNFVAPTPSLIPKPPWETANNLYPQEDCPHTSGETILAFAAEPAAIPRQRLSTLDGTRCLIPSKP